MSQPLRAPAPVVGLVHELIEYAAERHGERPFLLRFTSGSWSGYTFETAALAAGAVVVPLDAQLREQELGELLATAEATHAIGDARHLPLLDGARIAR